MQLLRLARNLCALGLGAVAVIFLFGSANQALGLQIWDDRDYPVIGDKFGYGDFAFQAAVAGAALACITIFLSMFLGATGEKDDGPTT